MTPSERRQTILIVDDAPDTVKMVKKRLESWGYGTLAAATGEEALRVAEEAQPDLILLDIMMPKMKGREACARLKTSPKTARIPVIFLTALGLPDHIKAGMDLDAEDYLVKPYEPEELREHIKVCLLRHSPP